ncbi:MAG: carbohydrate binding family 9 domain-containing protein [FCB group bacterium]|nr:carbohydrate binding family 9 domain-containing protein [FCB group bacterium]
MKYVRGIASILTLSILLLINICAADTTSTVDQPVPEWKAVRINPEVPVIDGNLDDEMWKSAKIDLIGNFRQIEPDEGQQATESTMVSVVYDDDAIYFAFWCYDSEPDKIVAQLVRRDRWAGSDHITVRLDPYHDHQTGYRFQLSAAGVQRDFRYFNDGHLDGAWDGVWESAVKRQPWGWSAEVRIPYHCLRFTEKDEHVWGCNVTRYISRKDESDYWVFKPSSEGGMVSKFGHLTGITGIQPKRQLNIMPYAVSSVETSPKSSGNNNGRDFMRNTGVDVKYALSSNLILDATVNPDFGQVEMDDPVLNLSAFETFFPERRPFFLEGSDLFDTRFMLFYSRRIGRSPQGLEDDSDVDFYTDNPSATSIVSAAKLTGKLSSGTSIGIINATTEEETAKYYSLSTREKIEGIVEPRANYTVARIKQDVFSNSNIGAMLTSVSQDGEHPAVTGGADWRLLTNNGVWGFHGQTIFSRVDNEDVGFGLTGELEKAAGKHFRGCVMWTIKDPNLHINRLGYTSRNDDRRIATWLQYRTTDDWFIFRNTYHNFNFSSNWNYAGNNISRNLNYNTYLQFINNWSFGGGISAQMEKYSDRETRGNGLWEWPEVPTYSWWASFNTDERKKVSLTLNPGGGTDRGGSWWAHYTGLNFRPRSNMEYSVGVNITRTFNATRWVENITDTLTDITESVFGDLDQNRLTFNLSASIMFHRNLSLQLSGEGLITSLDYVDYRKYAGEGQYTDLLPGEFEEDCSRNYSALNSTMILRWEYLPGSTLYLVWTRARSESDYSVNNLDFTRDFDRLFSTGAENVFLVKASYWWNI